MRVKFISAFVVLGVSSMASATLMYGHDMRNNRFVSFDSATPGTQTLLGTQTTDYFGLDFNASGSTLYGLSSTGNLQTINLANGAALSSVAISGVTAGSSWTGITFDASNNLFLSTFLTGTGSQLWSLNANTGAASLIGTMHASNTFIDISISSTGRLVAHDITSDSFFDINTGNGASTLIGAHGLAANFAQGMDFDWSTNTLYAAVYTGGGTNTYGSVNLTTGAVTPIGSIVSGEYELAAVNPVPEPATLAALGMGAIALIRRRKKA